MAAVAAVAALMCIFFCRIHRLVWLNASLLIKIQAEEKKLQWILVVFSFFQFYLAIIFFSDLLQYLKSKEAICSENTIAECTLRFIYLVLILYHFDCFHNGEIHCFIHTHTHTHNVYTQKWCRFKQKKVHVQHSKRCWEQRSKRFIQILCNKLSNFLFFALLKINIKYSYQAEVSFWNATPFEHIKLNAFVCTLKINSIYVSICCYLACWHNKVTLNNFINR